MTSVDRDRLIADYTTLGLGVVGLDLTTARSIAIEIVDEKLAAEVTRRRTDWADDLNNG